MTTAVRILGSLLLGLVAIGYVLAEMGALLALLLRLLEIPSVFDRLFPGMTTSQWVLATLVLGVGLPIAVKAAGALFEAAAEAREKSLRRRNAAALLHSIRRQPPS